MLDRAFAADRPFVIDAVVDADIPLIPPHLTADQVLKTAKAEFSGDPAFFGILADGVRETVVSTVKADWAAARPTDGRLRSVPPGPSLTDRVAGRIGPGGYGSKRSPSS